VLELTKTPHLETAKTYTTWQWQNCTKCFHNNLYRESLKNIQIPISKNIGAFYSQQPRNSISM